MILQEGVHGTESDRYDMFSELYFFNVGHELMNTEEGHPQIEQQSFVLIQKTQDRSKAGIIKNSCIILYNYYTVYIFYEPRLLKDICQIDLWMDIHCNVVVTSTNWVGNFPEVGRVWYHPNGIANILSLSKTAKTFRITYDI